MRYDGASIARLCGGRLVTHGASGSIATDTRALEPGAWFLALVGDRFDGHRFLLQARAAGCAGAVISGEPPDGWDRGLVRVKDTLVALQDLAAASRTSFQGPVVAITGSVGKTTTRALTALALGPGERVHATAGNLNNHIGLPLTLLARPEDCTLLVLELGMSAAGEIARLQEIARPDVRLITNVAPAHLEGLGSLEGVALAKGELFDGARPGDWLCVNVDDPRVAGLPHPSGVQVLRYGRSHDCDLRLLEAGFAQGLVVGEAPWVRYSVAVGGQRLAGRVPGPGLHMADNACAALATALALGCPLEPAIQAMEAYAPVGSRMRIEPLPGGIVALNDAYNANPASMDAALATLRSLPATRHVALLGDMLELGPTEIELHRALLEGAMASSLGLLGVCGPRMTAAAAGLEGGRAFVVAPDAEALAVAVAPHLQPGDVLLVKGSRGMAMERILRKLSDG